MAFFSGITAVAGLVSEKISTATTEISGVVAGTASKASELAAQTAQQLNETYDIARKTGAAKEAAVVYTGELKQQTQLGWSKCASSCPRNDLCLMYIATTRHRVANNSQRAD